HPTTPTYHLSPHDALPIYLHRRSRASTQSRVCHLTSTYGCLFQNISGLTHLREIQKFHCYQLLHSFVETLPRDAFVALSEAAYRSEEHTSELQSLRHLVCR